MSDDSGPVFGKRGQRLVPSDAVWDYDEQNLRVANAALDAELVLGQAALIDDPEHPPPVEVRSRVGDLVTEFTIQRRPSRIYIGLLEEPSDATWWCIDYNTMRLRAGRRSDVISPPEVDPRLWERFDDALRKAVYRLLFLRPGWAGKDFVRCVGGRIADTWYPKMFRGLGYSGWFNPKNFLRKLDDFEAMHRALPVLPMSDWRFETQPGPRIVHLPTGDQVSHEAGPVASIFFLLYEGGLGTFRFEVNARELWGWGSRPREWKIDTREALELRYGGVRDCKSPGIPGEARLSEVDWQKLDSFLTEALLRWPACEATGLRPVWLQFYGGYEEGAWRGGFPRFTGLDADMTGVAGCGR